jgi:ammonium transporter family
VCFWACTWLKRRFNYDDSLDVFGVHGIGGMTGVLLTGVFATASIGEASGLLEVNPRLVLTQLYGVAVTLGWSVVVTYALLKLVARSGFRCSRNSRASISPSTARRCNKLHHLNTIFAALAPGKPPCPSRGPVCLAFGLPFWARLRPNP